MSGFASYDKFFMDTMKETPLAQNPIYLINLSQIITNHYLRHQQLIPSPESTIFLKNPMPARPNNDPRIDSPPHILARTRIPGV